MGRLAEMQRKLLEVSPLNSLYQLPSQHLSQQMMGPEAMGVANANLVWSDDKVCRNFLCGTCPHTLFTNTVRFHLPLPLISTANLLFPENGSGGLPQISHREVEN